MCESYFFFLLTRTKTDLPWDLLAHALCGKISMNLTLAIYKEKGKERQRKTKERNLPIQSVINKIEHFKNSMWC